MDRWVRTNDMSGSAKAAPEQATTLATTFLVSVGGALAVSASFETAAAVVALAQASYAGGRLTRVLHGVVR